MLLLASLAVSCSEDTVGGFDSTLKTENFSFRPIAGGAIMHYTFPKDEDVVGMTVSYNDYSGKECLISASPMADSLKIIGFNEAKENVPAQVRFQKRNGEESLPINVTFSTHDSGPVAFFKGLKVESGWNGFTVKTNNPAESSGIAHIFYLGTNPYTNKEDTLLLSSFNIQEGCDTMTFKTKQKKDVNTIVVRTEDFRGYMVKQEVFENIASYNTAKLAADQLSIDWSASIEDPYHMIGKDMLTDGDTKCISYFSDNNYNHVHMTWAGPEAVGKPMYVDMKKNRLTAEVRFYEPLWIRRGGLVSDTEIERMLETDFPQKTPCDITVYGAKDDNGTAGNWDSKNWQKLGSFKQNPKIEPKLRWSYKCMYDINYNWAVNTKEDAEKEDSICCSVGVPAEGQDEGYRYLKIVFNDTFHVADDEWVLGGGNVSKYIFLSEMEVYTKKEE